MLASFTWVSNLYMGSKSPHSCADKITCSKVTRPYYCPYVSRLLLQALPEGNVRGCNPLHVDLSMLLASVILLFIMGHANKYAAQLSPSGNRTPFLPAGRQSPLALMLSTRVRLFLVKAAATSKLHLWQTLQASSWPTRLPP